MIKMAEVMNRWRLALIDAAKHWSHCCWLPLWRLSQTRSCLINQVKKRESERNKQTSGPGTLPGKKNEALRVSETGAFAVPVSRNQLGVFQLALLLRLLLHLLFRFRFTGALFRGTGHISRITGGLFWTVAALLLLAVAAWFCTNTPTESTTSERN